MPAIPGLLISLDRSLVYAFLFVKAADMILTWLAQLRIQAKGLASHDRIRQEGA